MASYVIDLSQLSAAHHHIDGLAVVFHIQPVADLHPVSVDRKLLMPVSYTHLGYGIDSVTNRGYCLSSQPDLLDATAIQSGLSTHFLGRNIVVLEETDSTNEEAKRQGAAGAPDLSLIHI